MSNAEPSAPRIPEDGLLWQLLKAYANEDWDWRAAPWPAPADQFIAELSPAEAQAFAGEMAALDAALVDDGAWRSALAAAQVDWPAFAADGALKAWAADLCQRASSPSPK